LRLQSGFLFSALYFLSSFPQQNLLSCQPKHTNLLHF
jgi:hypothetical protein